MRRTIRLFTKVAVVLVFELASICTQAADPAQPRPPVASISSPPDGAIFTAPVDIRILAAAGDADANIKTVEFFAGTNRLGVVPGEPTVMSDQMREALNNMSLDFPPLPVPVEPYRFIWTNAPVGMHSLTVVATDTQGLATVSEAVHITVNKPEPTPTVVSIVAKDAVAVESAPGSGEVNTAVFTISRTGSTESSLEVHYRLGGTASNGIDYRELVGTVTVPAGARSADLVVDPIDDGIAESTETVVVTLVEPACAAIFPRPADCYLLGRQKEAKAEIRDNDPRPTNRAPFVAMIRPYDEQVFLAPANVNLAALAFDFDGTISSVEFFEGEHSLGLGTAKAGDKTPTDRDRFPAPFYDLTWTNVSPGHYVLTALAKDNLGATTRSKAIDITVTTKEPLPVVSIKATDEEAAEEGATSNAPNTGVFTVSRAGGTNAALTVHYRVGGSAKAGVDYQALSGKVTIAAGSLTADIIVKPIEDKLVEGKQTVIAALLPCEAMDDMPATKDCYRVGDPHEARITILDNDTAPTNAPPKVAIFRPTKGSIFFAPADFTLMAEAKDADGRIKSVEFFEGKNSLGLGTREDDGDHDSDDHSYRLKWSKVQVGEYVLTAVATDNLDAKTTSESVAIKVVPKPMPPPIVTIKATDAIASEIASSTDQAAAKPDTATFLVTRSGGDTNLALSVTYKISGSAENGVDYKKLSGTVEIPKGATSAEIVVETIDDQSSEDMESVTLTLQSPVCIETFPPPPDCYRVGEAKRATVYIRDNDGKPNVSPKVALVRPTAGSMMAAPANIELKAETVDADGWVSLVEFLSGTNKIAEQSIVFIQAPPPGMPQTFSAKWTNVPPGKYTLTAKATDDRGASSVSSAVEVTVFDNTPRPIVTAQATDAEASEGEATTADAKTGTFKISRTGSTDKPLNVTYKLSGTAKNGVDYRELSGKATIAVGAAFAEVVVQPIDDKDAEGAEDVVLTIAPSECSILEPPTPDCYQVGRESRAVVLIRDNDVAPTTAPELAITQPQAGATFKAGADITIGVEAKDADGYVQLVEFMANDKNIGELVMQFLVAPPAGQKQTFTFKWNDVRTGKYTLTARATDNLGSSSVSKAVEITVGEPNALPVVTIKALDGHAAEANGNSSKPNTATFRVRREGSVDSELKVYYSMSGTASNSVDYATLPGFVTIAKGDQWALITLTPIDDKVPEPTETVVLQLTQPPTAAGQAQPAATYTIGRQDKAAATIDDNDTVHTTCVKLHDGHFVVCMPGLKDQKVRIEASDDLMHWEVVETNTVMEDDLHFVDTDSKGRGLRYYRVVRLPKDSSDD